MLDAYESRHRLVPELFCCIAFTRLSAHSSLSSIVCIDMCSDFPSISSPNENRTIRRCVELGREGQSSREQVIPLRAKRLRPGILFPRLFVEKCRDAFISGRERRGHKWIIWQPERKYEWEEEEKQRKTHFRK